MNKLVEDVASGCLDINDLSQKKRSYDEAKGCLMKYHGIGKTVKYSKVAECVLLFGLDKPEAFPIDKNIRRGLKRFCSLEGPDTDLFDCLQERWECNAGYASQLLFHGIRAERSKYDTVRR